MVKLQVQRGDLRAVRGDLVFVPLPEGDARAAVRRLDRRLATALARRLGAGAFRGRTDELLVHHGERTTAFLGIGRAPVADDAWRRAGARARQEAERQRARRVAVYLGENGASREVLAAFGEGFLLAGYRFGRYLSNDDGQRRVERLAMVGETVAGTAALRPVVSAVEAVVREVFRARDLVNEPASVKTPRFLAEQATALAVEIPGLEVEVWDAERIARENLAGLLGVARGSREEPRFIILRYAGAAAGPHVALVGKAITFDSGGLSLKPAKSMETMKYDMAGGAAVIGGVAAAARLGLPVRVTGYVPATENLPGGSAQKPGDVIRYRNGKTVEVLNTDAEGRLILADALALAAEQTPDAIVDLATLTGACVVALGEKVAGLMGDDAWVEQVRAAADRVGEPVWHLPLPAEYRKMIDSEIADIKNISGAGGGGALTAGLFLREFSGDVPWAHLDIAGPARAAADDGYVIRGGTGFGVRTLVELARTFKPPKA